jgi:hypothetical protein
MTAPDSHLKSPTSMSIVPHCGSTLLPVCIPVAETTRVSMISSSGPRSCVQ